MDVYTVKVLKPSGGKVWTSTPRRSSNPLEGKYGYLLRKGLKTLWWGSIGRLHRKGLKTLWKESMGIYSVKILKPCGGEVWTSTP